MQLNHNLIVGLVSSENAAVPCQECKDKIRSDDNCGTQIVHRYVKIPFTIGYFSGAIKMSMNVENDRPRGEVSN